MSSLGRIELNKWLRKININCDRVADIGVERNPNKDNVGSFECNEYITFDVEKTPFVDEILDLNKPYDKFKDYFDVIFCTQVFEHIYNPIQGAMTIYNMLRDKGILYLTSPFIYPHHSESDMLRYTGQGLKTILESVGFKDIEIDETCATNGKDNLIKFFASEGMHSPQLRDNYSFPIEYKIKAVKINEYSRRNN